MSKLTRRQFIRVSVSATGGLMLGFALPLIAGDAAARPQLVAGSEINAWLVINPDETVLLRIAQSEMGQGVMTSMAMILAEELEADWRNVRVEYADVNRQIRSDGVYGRMRTADSRAVRHSREYLQMAGAEARERLIKAAAERLLVPPAECHADYGYIHHQGSDRKVSFGEVAEAATRVSVAGTKIKSPREFEIIGLPTGAIETKAKVDGTAVFGIDVRRPGMVYATVLHCPVPGGKLRSLRYNAIREMPGVVKAVRMESAVAVVAETFWQAKLAADKLPVFWEEGPGEKSFSDSIKREFSDEFATGGEVLTRHGDIVSLMDRSEKTIESDYYLPYLAHAALEPINCTVEISEGRVDVWVGHQDPEYAARVVAEVAGVPLENVYLHNCLLGGSFGRRSHHDFVEEAVRIAMELDRPVQMIWTREEDMRAGAYRPMAALRFKAGFNIEKNLVAFTNHSVTHSVAYDSDSSFTGVDERSLEGLLDHPYRFPAYQLSHTRKNTHLTSWHWRSGGHSINTYALECFIDEMAEAAGRDPLLYRKELLQHQPAYLEVLNAIEQASGWRKRRLPRGSAMGMAIHESFGTLVALVADVSVGDSGSVTVDRITCVVDCGNVVNPVGAEKQVEGGILFGLSSALYGKLTVEKGRILEDNLDTYEVMGMAESPELDIHWALSGGDKWGGLGEPVVPLVAPAVCNALFKITQRRIRSLPVKDYYLRVV